MDPVSNTLHILALATRSYGAYGQSGIGVDGARAGFAGEIGEAELPWYLMGERFYVPSLRRFISPDTASPLDIGGLNRYAYCSGDPINRIDPSGEDWLDWVIIGVGLAVSVVALAASGGALLGAVGASVSGLAGAMGAAVSTPTMVTLVAAVALDTAAVVASIGGAVAHHRGDEKAQEIFGVIDMVSSIARLGITSKAKSLSKWGVSDKAIAVFGYRKAILQSVEFVTDLAMEIKNALNGQALTSSEDEQGGTSSVRADSPQARSDTTAFAATERSARANDSMSGIGAGVAEPGPARGSVDAPFRSDGEVPPDLGLGASNLGGLPGYQVENPLGNLPREVEKWIRESKNQDSADRSDDRTFAIQVSHPPINRL
ncbi:RHS repeat-associated core domain-containing protein [Luteibacter sp. NPDC031894]|uniref:RHS repeat-associated core domain-containing protein n=1 Tax=Luteibacter sp. NPDC031894 TaxID=3390572 RepID=UPI003D07FA5C